MSLYSNKNFKSDNMKLSIYQQIDLVAKYQGQYMGQGYSRNEARKLAFIKMNIKHPQE